MKLEEKRLVLPLTITNIVNSQLSCNKYCKSVIVTDSAMKRTIHFENDHNHNSHTSKEISIEIVRSTAKSEQYTK